MDKLSKPLTPAECNLRDFAFMPLDVKRMLTSETWILGTGDERSAAMTLWLESWHQVPAASLPDNDRLLGHLSQAKNWKRVKEHALRGWIKCDDGRLYHPVVAEKALEAWIEKLVSSLAGSMGNAKRWLKEVDTVAVSKKVVHAAALLAEVAPESKTLRKKQVAAIVRGSHADRDPIAPRPENVSPPDDFMSPPESPPESPGDRNREGIEVNPLTPLSPDGDDARSRAGKSSASFNRFWSAWPSTERKVAKAKCAEKWRKGCLDSAVEQIVAHVEAMKRTRQWRDGYEPAPLTYLNQRRWEDGMPGADGGRGSSGGSLPGMLSEYDDLMRGAL
ncbi:DUF1376 domain-containing protein [Burkholderia latens]|uniref:DUF1376 domain-containing protein n=1 Tax=Burkholderia latens TaxID=488446 RepID=UPI001AE49EA9|nr:DUF1376 domain-containing protein [Burkholderia latens]QTO42172.1 DUF1376 domain-containing protein [Burkholderia latens]